MPAFIFYIPAVIVTALVMRAVHRARKRDAAWLNKLEAQIDAEDEARGAYDMADAVRDYAAEAEEAALRG